MRYKNVLKIPKVQSEAVDRRIRQYSGKKGMKGTNNVLQNTTQKTKV